RTGVRTHGRSADRTARRGLYANVEVVYGATEAGDAMIDALELTVEVEMPPDEVEELRRRLASLDSYTDEPIISARLTLRRGPQRGKNRYVADASVLFGPTQEPARVLVAHVAGPSPGKATDEAVERLQRQLRRVVGAAVAERN